VPGLLVGGLVLAGGASVIAASGGSSSTSSAASTQYCPDGTPKPPSGECPGGHPGGPGEKPHKPKKHKKPKFGVQRYPRHGCITRNGTFVLRITVSNKPKGRSTWVYRDGRKLKTTRWRTFTLRIRMTNLRRGMHVVQLRVRGTDGKWVTRTIRVWRCWTR
jgi:hypothetical protein